ncbi:piggyBac transposable element-derived protein 4-like [Ixodes scapularis]|uniref:piggyBac transposable element-derived protein 4-like n=1 Tax=Ixodes scapularis TaxID=6945 RepID=UPI001C380326|nr:piggyBac transposable element-derived protein 4-like [Ixodes scapularis]
MVTRVVLKLMEPLLVKGYCVTIHNFYTPPELVDAFIKNYTDMYQTVRANRKDMPPEFFAPKLKRDDAHAEERGDSVALQRRDNKVVTVISTLHSPEIEEFSDTGGRDVVKPSTKGECNHIMRGVGKCDQMLANYPVTRKGQNIC